MNELIRSFSDDFDKIVSANSSNTALICDIGTDETTINYKELSIIVDRFLSLFKNKGLKSEDCILAILPNSAENLACCLATIKGGYGFAPLPCNVSKQEVLSWINLVKPRLGIIAEIANSDIQDAISQSQIDIISIKTDSSFDWLPESSYLDKIGGNSRIYLSTSGTEGEPKAIVIDGNKLWSSGCAFMNYLELNDNSLRFWNYLPMSYLGGLYNLGLIPLCVGASTVITEPFNGKTFLSFWQIVERFEINTLWLVPTIVRGLIAIAERTGRHQVKDYSNLIKNCFIGTAPIDLTTKQKFEQMFCLTMLENFALSETTFCTSETVNSINNRIEGSTGEILPYVELKIDTINPEDDQESKNLGEIKVKSPFLFLGYLQEDGEIFFPVDKDGYLATGDLGHISNNTLILDGRKRDIIKKGGYFISLREIEVLAEKNEAIAEAAAVKIPHDFYGESYLLFIRLKEGYKNTENDTVSWLHNNLVKYKWPENVIIKDRFPVTSSNKVRKNILMEENV